MLILDLEEGTFLDFFVNIWALYQNYNILTSYFSVLGSGNIVTTCNIFLLK